MANSKISVPVSVESTELQRLRSSICHLVEEQNRTNSKLIGVQVLTTQLDQKSEECRVFKSKLQQVEVLLSRAENRIAQLSLYLNGKGPSQGGIVTAGVSKRLLEAITRENTKLKLALEHVLNKQPNGVDLAVENHDLHDLVVALKEELHQSRIETEELRDALKAVETEDCMALQAQIARLTAQLTQTGRSLKAKQVYCESVVNENERLKSNLEAVKSERITQLASLRKLASDHPAIRDVLELTWCGDDVDGQNKELEKATKEITSLKKEIEDLKELNARTSQEKTQLQDVLTRQIDNLTGETRMLKEEIEKMMDDHQEVKMVKELLEGQCRDFENDFKMERQEKTKLESDLKKFVKQCQEVTQENKAIKNENERIKQLIKDEYEKKQKHQTSPTTPLPLHSSQRRPGGAGYMPHHFNPMKGQEVYADGGYVTPHFNPMKGHEQVCADGPSGSQKLKPYSRISGAAASYLECPVCKMILPPHEIEDHLNDCDGK